MKANIEVLEVLSGRFRHLYIEGADIHTFPDLTETEVDICEIVETHYRRVCNMCVKATHIRKSSDVDLYALLIHGEMLQAVHTVEIATDQFSSKLTKPTRRHLL